MTTLLTTTPEATGAAGIGGTITMIAYVALMFGAIYFMMIRPQKKERKKMAALLSSLEIGDSVLTNSGFYGTVIDIAEDTVIVEFGSNKNCRIPMQKAAIAQIEKPDAE
ncbi:MAG: preprotein translocase subunit YajC [Lachnospiraceae bacterium]|jgi:preprotein translocase subunit YajC|nr:preprotein translocase subunit YajC [Lachnospiraceae bacterium]